MSKKAWKNPIEGMTDTPAYLIAGTVANIYLQSQRLGESIDQRRTNREEVLKGQYGWSDAAMELFEKYLSGMDGNEAKRANKYRDENIDTVEADEYLKRKAKAWRESK